MLYSFFLSSKALTAPQRQLLERALNFAPTPKIIPTPQILEQKLRRVEDQRVVCDVRIRITGALLRAKPPPVNLTSSELKALKDLKKDKEIMVLKADKGGATIEAHDGDPSTR